jgi:hypothetical protein
VFGHALLDQLVAGTRAVAADDDEAIAGVVRVDGKPPVRDRRRQPAEQVLSAADLPECPIAQVK